MSKDVRKMINNIKEVNDSFNVTAYQGSNANHEGFDIKKIGTGEGNVVFGFGFYFTDCYEIAKFYENNLWIRKAFTYGFLRDFITWVVDGKYNPYKKEVYRKIVAEYQTNITDIINEYSKKGEFGKEIGVFLKKHLVDEKAPKIVYEVSLTLKNPIYWHTNNNKNVITILRNNGIITNENNGEKIYKEIVKLKGGFKQASDYLNSIGINSIIYNAGTRSGVENSKCTNYVIFNNTDININNKKFS